jgi:hypothetical protein
MLSDIAEVSVSQLLADVVRHCSVGFRRTSPRVSSGQVSDKSEARSWRRGPELRWDASTLIGRHAGWTVCCALMTSHLRSWLLGLMLRTSSCHAILVLSYPPFLVRLIPQLSPLHRLRPGSSRHRSLGPIRHSSGPRHAAPYCSLSELTIFDTRRVVDLVIIPATTEILEIDHLPRLAYCWEHKWETAQPNSFVGVRPAALATAGPIVPAFSELLLPPHCWG